MLFYPTLFLFFIYFKIARVHKKEEKMQKKVLFQHLVVFGSSLLLYAYGLSSFEWYYVAGSSLLFFIMAALLVTAVQLGIFVDGKPKFGISKVYKFLPLFTSLIFLSVMRLALT